MRIIEDLKWRYAVKKFDPSKKVNEETLQKILEAGNLAATSLGMQTYKFVLVRNKEIISKLGEFTWGEQFKGASHVIILAIKTDINNGTVDSYMQLIKELRNLDDEKLDMFGSTIKSYLRKLDEDQYTDEWAARQTYIVMGNILAACAEARVDSCPMEGIQKDKFDEILDLQAKNLRTVSAIPIGYRAEDDKYQNMSKVRIPLDEMIVEY